MSRLLHQLGVGADLFDPPLMHHDNLVGGQDRREPVCDRDHGSALGESFKRLLNLFFRFGIERRGGFIKEENRRILEQRASDGETLLLSTREQGTFVTDKGVVALRLGNDKLVGVGGLRGGTNFFGGTRGVGIGGRSWDAAARVGPFSSAG